MGDHLEPDPKGDALRRNCAVDMARFQRAIDAKLEIIEKPDGLLLEASFARPSAERSNSLLSSEPSPANSAPQSQGHRGRAVRSLAMPLRPCALHQQLRLHALHPIDRPKPRETAQGLGAAAGAWEEPGGLGRDIKLPSDGEARLLQSITVCWHPLPERNRRKI